MAAIWPIHSFPKSRDKRGYRMEQAARVLGYKGIKELVDSYLGNPERFEEEVLKLSTIDFKLACIEIKSTSSVSKLRKRLMRYLRIQSSRSSNECPKL